MQEVPFFSSDELLVPHGFFTRQGGVSSGVFKSLNCSYREIDSPENTLNNRMRAVRAIGGNPKQLVTLRQVHSACVESVESPWKLSEMPQADGLVTTTPGLVLGVMSADCAPVLMADVKNGVIGALHTGWRGLLANILGHGIEKMCQLGADINEICATIGPCIHQENYEVDARFKQVFMSDSVETSSFFKDSVRTNHYMFDFSGAVAYNLRRLGIQNVNGLQMDTYAYPDIFFSCRRAAHKKEEGFGTQISLITLGE